MEDGQEPARKLTYQNGWKRSTIGTKPQSKAAPESEASGQPQLWQLLWRRASFWRLSQLVWGWWSLPVVMFILFVWMVSVLAQLK